jgi:hypothetical protein
MDGVAANMFMKVRQKLRIRKVVLSGIIAPAPVSRSERMENLPTTSAPTFRYWKAIFVPITPDGIQTCAILPVFTNGAAILIRS